MREALKPVSALLISVAILLTGQGLQGTLLPIRASVESFSTTSIGLMGAAYFLGFTIGCLLGVYFVKRVGHIRVFLAMTAIASTTALIHALLLFPSIWILMRMLTGFCFAVLFVVIESWVNDRSSNENRGVIFSVYVMISSLIIILFTLPVNTWIAINGMGIPYGRLFPVSYTHLTLPTKA